MSRIVSGSNSGQLGGIGSAYASPVAGGSATELSATDAWAKAAVGGMSTTRENRLCS